MLWELTTICVIGILLLQWLKITNAKNAKLPPGPVGMPLVGHLFLLGAEPQKTLAKWAKTYGPILYCRFGSFPKEFLNIVRQKFINRTVVLSDAKLAKQMFSMTETAARPEVPSFLLGAGGKRGIIFSEGTTSPEQRHFALRNLRDHGMGKSAMGEVIQGDLSEFLDKVEASAGQPMTSKRLFNTHIINSLWSIVMTERMDTKKVVALTTILQEKVARLGSVISQLAFYMPWIETVTKILTLGTQSVTAERVNGFQAIYAYMKEQLMDRQQSWQKGQPRDVMDAYFDKVDDTTDIQSSFHSSHDMSKNFAGDLFMGGVETTSSTLEWMLKNMATYPEVQKKVQEEIDQVVGNIRPPTTADKVKMPYTDAVLHELLRMAVILPFGVQHRAVVDFEFQGFLIPKGTQIICNFYAVHRDPQVFPESHAFKPERWMGEGGKELLKNFMPFSTGKRFCVGEALARDQVWMYMTNIFQRYNLTFADPHQPKIQQQFGFAVSPSPFKIVFQPRQSN